MIMQPGAPSASRSQLVIHGVSGTGTVGAAYPVDVSTQPDLKFLYPINITVGESIFATLVLEDDLCNELVCACACAYPCVSAVGALVLACKCDIFISPWLSLTTCCLPCVIGLLAFLRCEHCGLPLGSLQSCMVQAASVALSSTDVLCPGAEASIDWQFGATLSLQLTATSFTSAPLPYVARVNGVIINGTGMSVQVTKW